MSHENEQELPPDEVLPSRAREMSGGRKDLATKLISELESDPEFIREMAQQIRKSMRQTKAFFNKDTKEWEEREDGRVQIDAIKLVLAYSAGLPLQRTITMELTKSVGPGGLVDALRDSPGLLAAVERQIEKAKFHGRHLQQVAATSQSEP